MVAHARVTTGVIDEQEIHLPGGDGVIAALPELMRHQRLVHAGARLLGDAHGDVALATDARRVRLVGRVAVQAVIRFVSQIDGFHDGRVQRAQSDERIFAIVWLRAAVSTTPAIPSFDPHTKLF